MQKPLKPVAKLRCSSVLICAQSLVLPAGARLQGFLAQDLPNSRMNFVFCSCDPPCSGRRMFNHVIFSGVLTDLFLRRSPATNANVPLSPRLRSVLENAFIPGSLVIRKCVLIRTTYLKLSWSVRGQTWCACRQLMRMHIRLRVWHRTRNVLTLHHC